MSYVLAAEEKPDPGKAVTVEEPLIDPAALSILVMPLTKSELENEIVAWQKLLHASLDKSLRLRAQRPPAKRLLPKNFGALRSM